MAKEDVVLLVVEMYTSSSKPHSRGKDSSNTKTQTAVREGMITMEKSIQDLVGSEK